MTSTDYTSLIVIRLRQLCGERGLPKYQHHNRRLRKVDLVRQLQQHDRAAADPARVPDRHSRPLPLPTPVIDREGAILATLAGLTMTTAERRAFRRLFAGATDAKSNHILRCRELRAVAVLREAASTEGERMRWHNEYVRRARGV